MKYPCSVSRNWGIHTCLLKWETASTHILRQIHLVDLGYNVENILRSSPLTSSIQWSKYPVYLKHLCSMSRCPLSQHQFRVVFSLNCLLSVNSDLQDKSQWYPNNHSAACLSLTTRVKTTALKTASAYRGFNGYPISQAKCVSCVQTFWASLLEQAFATCSRIASVSPHQISLYN